MRTKKEIREDALSDLLTSILLFIIYLFGGVTVLASLAAVGYLLIDLFS